MRNAFARALRAARKARGLTQEDFSLVSSRTYLSSLERGQKSPTLDKVQALARIIGIHPLTLLTLTCLYFEGEQDIDRLFTRVRNEIAEPGKESAMIRLVIADDHAIMREGLKQLFGLVADIRVAAEAADGAQALKYLADGEVDLLLLDMSMPGLCGNDLIRHVRGRHPPLPILILSMHIEPQIAQGAFDAGANGYLGKDLDPETLLDAVRAVAGGGSFLDPKLSGQVTIRAGLT